MKPWSQIFMMPVESPPHSLAARCVVILNSALPAGKAANAAAVLALTLGQRHPHLVGEPLVDAASKTYPGLIAIGISVLSASGAAMSALFEQTASSDLDCVIFPSDGQQTTNYAAFRAMVLRQTPDLMQLAGIGLVGEKQAVRKLTANLKLWD